MESSDEAQDAVTPPLPPALALPARGWGHCRGPGPRAEGGRAQPNDSQAGKPGRAHAGPGQAARAIFLLEFSNTHPPEFCFSSPMTFRSHLSSLEKKGLVSAQVQTQEERRQDFLCPDWPLAAWRPETLLSSEGWHLGHCVVGRPPPLSPCLPGPQRGLSRRKGSSGFGQRFAIKGAIVPCWLRAT